MSLPIKDSITFEIIITNYLLDPTEVNDAVVTVKVEDNLTGDEVLEVTTVPYVPLSSGLYRVTVDPIDALVKNKAYKVTYNAESAGLKKNEEYIVIAK